eukprot:jgi/Mesvir1/29233/Mv11414-RA.1
MEGVVETRAFLTAAESGDAKLVMDMIVGGVHVDSGSPETGRTAQHNAAALGHKAVVSVLLRHGASTDEEDYLGRTPLEQASFNGHTQVVDMLLRAGADTRPVSTDMSPLHRAASRGHEDSVQLLLDAGLRVNAKSAVSYLKRQ